MPRRFTDPYASFNFLLVIDGVTSGGFSECSGLQMEVKTFDYKEGGNNQTTLKFPEHASYGNITLKRGVTTSNELISWQLGVNDDISGSRSIRRAVTIILQDEIGDEVKRWELTGAFPVKWMGPDFKANASEIAIESLELAHQGIQEA
jgi:phage tail-like protein